MDFVTPEYYTIFIPIVVILVLFLAKGKKNAQVLVMLTMSYVFFWLASGWHILLLLTSTIVDWKSGQKIHSSSNQKHRKRWLMGSLVINLGLLASTRCACRLAVGDTLRLALLFFAACICKKDCNCLR